MTHLLLGKTVWPAYTSQCRLLRKPRDVVLLEIVGSVLQMWEVNVRGKCKKKNSDGRKQRCSVFERTLIAVVLNADQTDDATLLTSTVHKRFF